MAENGPVDGTGDESGAGEVTIEFVEHAEGPHSVPAGLPADLGLTGPAAEQAPLPSAEGEDRATQLENQLVRLRADFENYRRRSERDRAEIGDRAQAQVLKSFLSVLDNMDRAMALLEQEAPPEWCRGMALVQQSFAEALTRAGVEVMDARGKPFDPAFHDAVTLCRDERFADGVVADVLERGYLHRGRLLRPAKVRVNRLSGEPQEETGNG